MRGIISTMAALLILLSTFGVVPTEPADHMPKEAQKQLRDIEPDPF